MKRVLSRLLAAGLVLTLVGCGTAQEAVGTASRDAAASAAQDTATSGTNAAPASMVTPARLTKQETDLLALFLNANQYLIYDLQLPDTVNAYHVQIYALADGAWEPFAAIDGSLFDPAWGTVNRLALQMEENSLSVSHTGSAEQTDLPTLAPITAIVTGVGHSLDEAQEITPGEEFPLYLYATTSTNHMSKYGLSGYSHPEEFTPDETAFAITLTLLSRPL